MATEQQIPKLAGALVEHQRHFGALSPEDAQWVIENTREAIALFAGAVASRKTEALKEVLVRTVSVPALVGRAALEATNRRLYVDDAVVATMPHGQVGDGEIEFFQVGHWISPADLKKEYEIRGLVPDDPHSLAAFNAANPTFADTHPNATQWQDADGRWCYAAFLRFVVERRVRVRRFDVDWRDFWWFAGRRK